MSITRLLATLLGAAAIAGCANDSKYGTCTGPDGSMPVQPTPRALLDQLKSAGFDIDAVRDDGTVVVVTHDFCHPTIPPSVLEKKALAALTAAPAPAPAGKAACGNPPVIVAKACMVVKASDASY